MSEFDNTIDFNDDLEGSDGGYTRSGHFIPPDAMQEILMLRGKVEALEQQLKAAKADAVRECGEHIMQGLLSRQVNAHEFEEYAKSLEGK